MLIGTLKKINQHWDRNNKILATLIRLIILATLIWCLGLRKNINRHSTSINYGSQDLEKIQSILDLYQKKIFPFITTFHRVWGLEKYRLTSTNLYFPFSYSTGAAVEWRTRLEKNFSPHTTSIEKIKNFHSYNTNFKC